MTDDEDPDDYQPQPPSAEQVARRALILSAVSCRGILELDPDRERAERFWDRVMKWWQALDLEADLEPEEAALLASRFGTARQQDAVDESWRSEALGVIAWALGQADVISHDRQVDPSAVANSLGFLEDHTVLESPRLRSPDELNAYLDVAFTVHWRLREFSLNPGAMDFAEFCRTAWFGPLSLKGVRLLEGDLALGDLPISRAPTELVQTAMSIAQERHQAANWLVDASQPLSETDTST
ncbi:MAG: DUF4272 domain-containing protein [Polyangiaceae bacterium]